MPAARRAWAADLLHFWFCELRPTDWFGADRSVDAELHRRYARWLVSLRRRPAREFLSDPRTARAAVLLFDQVPRNVYRGSARAFAFDPLARAITRAALARGFDTNLRGAERQFFAMPLMHSEAIGDQLWSLHYFTLLGPRYGAPFARSHYRMIARFGRFPHRNAVLGRPSTEAEKRAVAQGFAW